MKHIRPYFQARWREAILVHLPVGVFCAWLTQVSPVHGVLVSAGFLAYEAMQDWRKVDNSFKDVFGFLVGYAPAAAILSVV